MTTWHGLTRSDGLRVAPVKAAWLIVVPPDNQIIGCCPRCGMLLHSEAEAKDVADTHYAASR